MKVGKDGKLKLSKDERQFGNFIIKKNIFIIFSKKIYFFIFFRFSIF